MAKPLDFVQQPNHDWAQRYIANKMGLKGLQEGGQVSEIPSLRKSPKRLREKARDFLTNISEKSKVLDFLYHSPEESFDKAFGDTYAFGTKPRGHFDEDRGEMEMVLGEGLKELWKESGSPRVKVHDERHAAYEPAGAKWLYGKKTPLSFLDYAFGADKMYVPEDYFGFGGDKDLAISELAHGLRFADPEQYSKYGSRKELILGKGQEHGGQELYTTPGTEEYATHREVEPILRNWIIENYPAGFQEGGQVRQSPMDFRQPSFDPFGSGYDIETALEAGLDRDEYGHMGSLDPRTGMVLKGRGHESWNPMVQTEMGLGSTVEYEPDKGRFFAKPMGMYESAVQDETGQSQMDRILFENELAQQPQYSMSAYEEGYNPAREIAEGAFLPIGGAISLAKSAVPRIGKKSRNIILDHLKSLSDIQRSKWTSSARKGADWPRKESLRELEQISRLRKLIEENM